MDAHRLDAQQWSFDASPEQIGAARAMVRSWLQERGTPEATVADAVLVISELVTNGVIHGAGDEIGVAADIAEGGVRLRVVSIDAPEGQLAGAPRFRDAGRGGHGLAIVRALSQDFGVHHDGRSRIVSCRLPAEEA